MASPITITTDELKTQIAWMERFLKVGGKISDFQASIDDPNQLRRIVQYIKAAAPSVLLLGPSYDASSILSFGQPILGDLPQAEPGEVVIWYGGWSLQQLRDNTVVRERNLMWDQDWYNKYDWSTEELSIGFYRLKIPVPNSNKKLFYKQTALLLDGEQVAHPVLVATADLCHEIQTSISLLEGIYVRTSKQGRDSTHVGLYRGEGRLFIGVDSWHGHRGDDTYLASARGCA